MRSQPRPLSQAAARRVRCAAFSCVATLVRCTQATPKFYAVAIDSKDDRWVSHPILNWVWD